MEVWQMGASQEKQNKLGGNWACKDLILWLYWRPFASVVQKCPTFLFYGIARLLTHIFKFLARTYCHRLSHELTVVFGNDLSTEKRKRMIQEACFVYICNELEVLRFPALNSENVAAHIELVGAEHIGQGLKQGKGVMLLFAHFGANQMVMPAMGYRGYTMNQMGIPATAGIDTYAHRQLSRMEKFSYEKRWEHEQSLPANHINVLGSLKKAFLCLRSNEVLGIALDGAGGEIWAQVPFLGRKAQFSYGALDIGWRSGAVILPTFVVRGKNGRNTMQVLEPLRLDTRLDKQEALLAATGEFAGILEQFVLEHPGHYLNFLLLRSFKSKQNIGAMPLFPGDDE